MLINEEKCNSCKVCLSACTLGAIIDKDEKIEIDTGVCANSEMCPAAMICPQQAIERAEKLWEHPIFENLPWVMLLDLALDFQPLHLPTGRLLFEYGKLGHECYMLISGSVAIFDKNLKSLGTLEDTGEFFGARSVLFNQPRNAFACIAEDAELWALPAPALKRLQFVYPGVILHLRAVELLRSGEGPLVSALEPLSS